MKIELLDPQTVKIVLSYADMNNLSITYDEMDYSDQETKNVITLLLKKIEKETSLDLTKSKLFVEAFPYKNGGCILYINVLTQNINIDLNDLKPKINEPMIFLFNGFNDVCDACMDFFNNYNHLIFRSSLYFYNKNYCMMIYSFFKLDRKITSVISEYGNFYGKGELMAAHVKEHGSCIMDESAIEQISEIF